MKTAAIIGWSVAGLALAIGAVVTFRKISSRSSGNDDPKATDKVVVPDDAPVRDEGGVMVKTTEYKNPVISLKDVGYGNIAQDQGAVTRTTGNGAVTVINFSGSTLDRIKRMRNFE